MTTEEIVKLEEEATELIVKLADDLNLFSEEENKTEWIRINL